MSQKKDPSAVVVPFGKYKGATVAELLVRDHQYADWIMAQGWVAERFAELHTAIASRGAGIDDTPEHNALQVRFLDEKFRVAFLTLTHMSAIQKLLEHEITRERWDAQREISKINSTIDQAKSFLGRWADEVETPQNEWAVKRFQENKEELAIAERAVVFAQAALDDITPDKYKLHTAVEFEAAGVDVWLKWTWSNDHNIDYHNRNHIAIELKPSLGDDYPTVMRQMRRLYCHYIVVGQYTGRGISEPQLREMFNANGMRLVFTQEIEEALQSDRPDSAGQRNAGE